MNTRRWVLALLVLAMMVGAGLLYDVSPNVGGPRHVRSMTFVNPTPYDLDVDATGDDQSGWVGVRTAHARTTDTAEEIVDLGDTWIMRFSYGGHVAGELRRSRAELEGARWRVEIPAEFSLPLEAAGIAPAPLRD